jgi:hypothetical protein
MVVCTHFMELILHQNVKVKVKVLKGWKAEGREREIKSTTPFACVCCLFERDEVVTVQKRKVY